MAVERKWEKFSFRAVSTTLQLHWLQHPADSIFTRPEKTFHRTKAPWKCVGGGKFRCGLGKTFIFNLQKKKKIFLLPFGKFSNNEIRLLSEGTARKARLNTKESRSALHSANCFKSSTVQSPVIIDFSIFPSGLLSCSYQFLVHVALRLRKSINARRASSRLEWRDEQRDEKLSSLVQ